MCSILREWVLFLQKDMRMIRIYSDKKACRILAALDPVLLRLQDRYGVPRACLQAVLEQEITGMDIMDWAADMAVELHWLWFRLQRKAPFLPAGRILKKRDSSTGYAQVFARTAIQSIHFAYDRNLAAASVLGLPDGCPARPATEEDLCRVWRRLHRDPSFNAEMAALTLLAAAEEMTGRLDFGSCSPEEMQLIFTRYNAHSGHITPYGQQAYRRYLRFSEDTGSQAVFSPGALS